MVVAAVVVESIKAMDMDALEVADTKEGDIAAVGGAIPLAASMVLLYQTAIIIPMNLNKREMKDVPKCFAYIGN